MQGRTADRRTRQPHRSQHRIRRQHTGSSDRDHDVLQNGLLDLRRVFVRRRPPRILGRRAEPSAQGKVVDLDDRAVDIKIQLSARLAHPDDLRLNVLQIGQKRIARRDRESQLFQIIQRLHVGCKRQIGAVLDVKAEDRKPSLPRDLTVQLTQRAGRGIARIGERRLSVQLALCIQRIEHRAAQIHLTAHNQLCRCLRRKHLRDVLDRAQIVRDILADRAVAAGRTADEHAVFIFQRDRQSVDLVLHRIRRCRRPLAELRKLPEREHILQTLQRPRVGDRRELGGCRAADTVGRGFRIVVFRILPLQRLECAEHPVVFKVRNLRRILVVVLFIVIPQLVAERGDFLRDIHTFLRQFLAVQPVFLFESSLVYQKNAG